MMLWMKKNYTPPPQKKKKKNKKKKTTIINVNCHHHKHHRIYFINAKINTLLQVEPVWRLVFHQMFRLAWVSTYSLSTPMVARDLWFLYAESKDRSECPGGLESLHRIFCCFRHLYSINCLHGGYFLSLLLLSTDFFKINFFRKLFQEHYQCQTVWIHIRTDVL